MSLTLVQVIVTGLLVGAVYALFSSGLTLIWGMMNVINFAHGDFVMLGMYTAFVTAVWLHGGPVLFGPAAAMLLFALGWLCVAQARGTAAIAEDCLRGALSAFPAKLRSDSPGQCHGLAGVGEVYLEAHRVLGEECWRERAADIANVLVALFRRRSRKPWSLPPEEPAADADGLMLGTASILHFLLRHHHPAAVTSAPLLA